MTQMHGCKQDELRVSRMEETRIRQALQVHEAVIHKNREELNRYRTYMETRDDEMRKTMQMEEERLRTVLDEYKERYDRERARLQVCRSLLLRLPSVHNLSMTVLLSLWTLSTSAGVFS